MRHRRPIAQISPAEAMRAALAQMRSDLRTAQPDKAGDLAKRLATLARDLAAHEREERERTLTWEEEVQRQNEFDAEIERLIGLRAREMAERMLEEREKEGD